jgi:hypothetical protein
MTFPLTALQTPGTVVKLTQAGVKLAGFVPPGSKITEVLGLVNVTAAGLNNIVTTVALVSTVPQSCTGTPAGGTLVAGVATLDFPRTVGIKSAGTDTATVLITGTDLYGMVMTQLLTLNGTTAVYTTKAFMTVVSITAISATPGNNIVCGTGVALGLSYKTGLGVVAAAGVGAKNTSGTISADAGTMVVADNTIPATNLTGDVRGTYLPSAAEAAATTTFFIEYTIDPVTPFGQPQV